MTEQSDPSPPTGAAQAALEWVREGMKLGLGTGRAASAFVQALGARVADGFEITGVPTSEATAELARGLGIPLARLAEIGRLDITFDGADEVDERLDVIKGYGAAMVREKVVARSSDQLIILVGPEKLVSQLGEHGRLPIEVLPFGEVLVRGELAQFGLDAELRVDGRGETLVTDNGNWILDVHEFMVADPLAMETAINNIAGVVCNGLFAHNAAKVVLVSSADGVMQL